MSLPATTGDSRESSALMGRAMSGAGSCAARVGARTRRILASVGSAAWLAVQVFRASLRIRTDQVGLIYAVTRMQVRFTALDALALTLFTALLLGGITLLQVFSQLSGFGAENYLSQLMARLVLRELGPLLVAIVVIGRSGTAIAAELASMRLNGEIDALCAMGVNPLQFVLAPRVVGGMISMFTLIICFDAAALLGGFFVARLRLPLSLSFYLNALGSAIGGKELAITLLKGLVFGGTVPLLCASYGLRVRTSPTEIPQAVTKAVVASLLAVFLSGALLSVAIYG
ncbi:MAG TPA: ABC transporter permease [Holophaga sp.]|nr:ABC transporter permease [Holophaga sp.]